MGKRAASIPSVCFSASVGVDRARSSRPSVLCSIENLEDKQHNRTDGLNSPVAKKQRRLELNQTTTPAHNPFDVSCLFSQARSLLRQPPACSNIAPIGREQQSKQIENAVHNFVDSGIGKSVYVSGLPGTGKSHTVRKILQQLNASHPDPGTVTWVNCMSVNSPSEVYAQVAASVDQSSSSCAALTSHQLDLDLESDLDGSMYSSSTLCSSKRSSANITTYQQLVERLSKPLGNNSSSKTPDRPAPRSYRATRSSNKQVSSSGNSSSSHVDNDLAPTIYIKSSSSRRHIIVLDEIDNLAKKSTSALVQLFLLPYEPGMQVLLIGIANSIDLTERTLPELKMKMVSPELICFPAYSTKQLMAILSACMEAMPCKLFEPPAVELCARSVATSSGDLRHALKVCRAAVDELERQHKQLQQQDAPSSAAAVQEVPTVTARYMISALKQLASGSVRSSHFGAQATNSIRSLPNQQQLLLYSLSVLCKPKDAVEDRAADQQLLHKKQKSNASSLWKAAGTAASHGSAGNGSSKTPGKKLGAGSVGSGCSQQIFVLSVDLDAAYAQYKQVCKLLSLPPCTRPELLHMAELLSLGHTGVALVEVIKAAGGSSSGSSAGGLGPRLKVGWGKGGLGGLGGQGFGSSAASLRGGNPSKSAGDVWLSLKASAEEVEAALQHNPALRCLVQK